MSVKNEPLKMMEPECMTTDSGVMRKAFANNEPYNDLTAWLMTMPFGKPVVPLL